LLYSHATGEFSSRKIEKATYESIPFRFLAGGWHPDHDTIAHFRKAFLAEITDLLVQVRVVSHELWRSQATSAWMAARFMPVRPRAMQLATAACCSWNNACALRWKG
jgi:hypothetical protein